MKEEIIYNDIGNNYDYTRYADPYILNKIIQLLGLPSGSKIIDVACGTGNYTVELRRLGYSVTGLDISTNMLIQAKSKSSEIEWLCANVENIPIQEYSFNGAICTLACHHFKDLKKAFSEIYRVMSHGKFVLFTCSHKQIRHYWLYRYFPKALEIITTYMPDFQYVIDTLCSVGFKLSSIIPYYISSDLKDNFLGARFEKPELYLDENFRNGMSIFAKKTPTEFIEEGCSKLAKDLKNGAFSKYISNFSNPYGDYMFITVEK